MKPYLVFINRLVLLIVLGSLGVSPCFAQETPEELGIAFLNVLKSEDSLAIKKIIPNPEKLIAFSKTLGMEKTEDEISEFLLKYPNEVNKYISKCQQLKAEGEALGIKWHLTEFIDVEILYEEEKFTELSESINTTQLNVIFSFDNRSYKLILNTIFEFENSWFLAGDQPELDRL